MEDVIYVKADTENEAKITGDHNNKGVKIKVEGQVGKLHQLNIELWLNCERRWLLGCGITM